MNGNKNRGISTGQTSGPSSPPATRTVSTPVEASALTLPDYLVQVRKARKWSRPQVSGLADISLHHLRRIEKGTRTITTEVIDQLITAYQLTPAQARYARELLRPPLPLPYPPGLRTEVRQTPDLLEHLAQLEDRGVLGIYTDPIGNVLALNTPMRAGFPALEQVGNTMLWWFSPEATQLIIDWDTETDLVVAWFKAAIACYRSSPEVSDLLGVLCTHGAFLWPWVHSTRVVYTRPTGTPLRLRRLRVDGTLAEYSVIVQSSHESDTGHVLLHTLTPLDRTHRSHQ